MVIHYQAISHEKTKPFTKNDIACHIFDEKDFKDYKKELENQNRYVHVLANTCLKPVNKKSNQNMIEITKEKRFQIHKHRHRFHTIGYIPVSETDFVRIESGIPLLYIFLLLLLCITTAIYMEFNPKIPNNPSIDMDNTHDWDGNEHQNGDASDETQDNTVIPGFASIKADSTASNVQLYNPKENTVNFVYTILEYISETKVETVESIDDAQKYITKYTHDYQNDNSSENRYLLIDKTTNETTDTYVTYKATEKDDRYVITKQTYKIVYFTKGIAPGQAVDWNIYQSLGTGNYDLQFRISTFDVETNQPCYGAVLDVKATIK